MEASPKTVYEVEMITTIKKISNEWFDKAVEYRRYFHENPCLSFHEGENAQFISEQLDAAGIEHRRCGENGVVAVITGSQPGPTIAFRGDFDALPIDEPRGLPFCSKNPGVMHACGHDAHISSLLTCALALKENAQLIRGKVVFIFQYAEEIPPGGALPMIEDGCLDGVDRIYGFHVSEELETGSVGICPGAAFAASDGYFVEFLGNGGHGSRPYETQDTVSAAASATLQINSIVSRFISPYTTAVISTCNVHGGNTYNVIPPCVRLEGTVRSYEKETAELIRDKLHGAVKAAAELYGTEYSFKYEHGYPAVVNCKRETEIVERAAQKLGIPFHLMMPTPVGEDFSRYLEHVPGAFFRVGIRNEAIGAKYSLHNRNFRLDENALKTALEIYLGIYLVETGQIL